MAYKLAKYTPSEFFYDEFEDYCSFSGVPYTGDGIDRYTSTLARDISKIDNGDGVLLNSDQVYRRLGNLNKYEEFKKCKVHLINEPVVKNYYMSRATFSVESELINVASFDTLLNSDFEGESFFFEGVFYLYSIQFYGDNERYYMRIRGYEDPV